LFDLVSSQCFLFGRIEVLPQSVDRMLLDYRRNKARCAHLEIRIRELEELRQGMVDNVVNDTVSITARLDGMPPAQPGTSDPTGRLSSKLADGYKTDSIRQVEGDIAGLTAELQRLLPQVHFVDAWLLALDDKERFVVEQKQVAGVSWRELVFAFKREHGAEYSVHGLRKLRDRAVQKIYQIAE